MIDLVPDDRAQGDLWGKFRARAEEADVADVRCVVASIDDPATPERVGVFDVVHCSGVLYHCPQPLHTLQQLAAITGQTLILGTATMPERVTTPAGTVEVGQGGALLVPALSYSQRTVLGDWLLGVGGTGAMGLTAAMDTDWSPGDYAAWWWFFSRDFVAALLHVAGFEVQQVTSYWEGRATLFHASKRSVG
jgi:hypothetical protein